MKWLDYKYIKPETTGQYLVSDGTTITIANWNGRIWSMRLANHVWVSNKITHFMPLPESPNEYNTEQ